MAAESTYGDGASFGEIDDKRYFVKWPLNTVNIGATSGDTTRPYREKAAMHQEL